MSNDLISYELFSGDLSPVTHHSIVTLAYGVYDTVQLVVLPYVRVWPYDDDYYLLHVHACMHV